MAEPLYYVAEDGRTIFKRPVENVGPLGTVVSYTMGFRVCEVDEFVDPDMVCQMLNEASNG